MTERAIAIFWTHFNKEAENGCWEWTASLKQGGYGQAWDGQRVCQAHRLSWEIAHGPIPEGLWVLHKCPVKHNRKCVNPDHLKLGTVKENARDAVETGGIATGERHGTRTHPEAIRRGELCSWTDLSDDAVMEVRRRWAAREASLSELATEKRLSIGAISSIVAGRSWQHLPILPRRGIRKMPPDHPAHVRMRTATHCPNGHEYTEANTRRQGGGKWRRCRTCINEWARRNRAAKAKGGDSLEITCSTSRSA